MKADVVIIGAGVAGITCAIGLLESGLDVVVVEALTRLGGRAQSWPDETTGDEIDIGPHVLTNEHRNVLRLLDLLGTARDVIWRTENFLVLAGEEPLVMKRYPLPAPLSLLPNLFRVGALSRRDLASNTSVVILAMKLREEDVLRLDTVTAESFLRNKGVTQRFIDWFWKSACMTFMNVPLERCSAGALLRVFNRMLVDNRFRFGFAAQGLGRLFAPAADRLAAAGAKIITGRSVQAVQCRSNKVTGVRLNDGSRINARFCVSTIPPQTLARIIPEPWANARPFSDLFSFEPVPYISCYIWFDRKMTTEPMWTRLWSEENLNYDFYDLSNIRPGWRHRDSVIASNIINNPPAQSLSDEAIVEMTVAEMAEFIPQAAQAGIRHARVHRIPMAITAPYPGMERKRPDARTPIGGLFLAGDWTNTRFPSSMESAARSGWLAAEQIWENIGRPRQLALPMEQVRGIARLLKFLAPG